MEQHNLKSMSEVMSDLKNRGFKGDFQYENKKLIEHESGRTYESNEIKIVNEYRFEGNSNPDDTSILLALETHDGIRGLVVNNYGLDANVELNEFLMRTEKVKK